MWHLFTRKSKTEQNKSVNFSESFVTIEKQRAYLTRPFAQPSTPTEANGLFRYGDFVAYPYCEPQILFPFLRYLRDSIPDVSAGIWAWVRLCARPHWVEYIGGTSKEQLIAKNMIEGLDKKIYEFDHMKQQGMDALINAFFLSVFTYGAFAGEVVLNSDRKSIEKFYIIDPATIKFKRFSSSRRLVPYQVIANEDPIRLNEASFFYFGLDTDGDNPYGRSPLLALPFVTRIQMQLFEDMGKAMHNAGYPTLHIKYTPPEKQAGEAIEAYQNRIKNNFEKIRTGLRDKKADSNYLTYDNVEILYIGPNGQSQRWSESLQAVSEQVVSALHLAPFMLGRNWGTTESWGRAQYDLIINNALSVQRGAKRMCEWLRNLELALAGLNVQIRHHFRPHNRLNELDNARAFEARSRALIKLLEKGLVEAEEIKSQLAPQNLG